MSILLRPISQSRIFVTLVFGLCVSGMYVLDTRLLSRPQFVVEMRSDTNATAQLFYDVGRGLNEADSAGLPVDESNTYATLHFPLPRATIRALRFDPINGPGTFSVRHVYIESWFGYIERQFGHGDLVALNQIATSADTGSELQFSTTPAADDPMLQVVLRDPIAVSSSSWTRIAFLLVELLACLLVTAVIALVYSSARSCAAFVSQALDRLAVAVGDPAFIVVDRVAIGFYLGVLTVFLLASAAGLHGSSISIQSAIASGRVPVRPLIGTAKLVRSDEWAYHTPAILYQLYRSAPLDDDDTPLGPDHTSLISNIPVRHFTTLLRPQFWSFFVLPPAYAFAFYWQCKAMLLLTGVFSLLLLLTQSSRIAAFGAFWYAFSPHVQWDYSWPSLLPEMIGLFCIVMCALFYMSVGRRPALLATAAAACAVAAVDFALCAYIPHQIPLVWLGVCLCIWWISAKWKTVFTRDHALPRIAALSSAWLLVALVMFAFYRDAEPIITIMANTSYPGQRSLSGGGYTILALFSHFFSFWVDDQHLPVPQLFGNICEVAGFLWLAPVTLFSMHRVVGDAGKRRAYWILAAFGAFLFTWMTIPLPHAIGSVLFMDKSGSGRSVHVLGLVNVALVALALSFQRARVETKSPVRRSLLLAAAVFAIVYPVFRLVNSDLANFLTSGQLVTASGYTTVLIVAVAESRFALLASFLVLPHLAVFGLVNPIDRGLRVVEFAPLFRFVHARPELLRHKWIVFSGSFPDSGAFSSIGCDLVNGLKYVPDFKALSVFDQGGAHRDLMNRSAWLLAEPEFGDRAAAIEEVPPNLLRLRVSPLDPALGRIDVRYAAFVSRPPAEVEARMKSLGAGQIGGFWLYELP
jgi:hypothetical protein